MLPFLQKPAGRIGLAIVSVVTGTEAFFYFDNNRHATSNELALATTFALLYFSLLEGMVATRFIVRSPDSDLVAMLRLAGFGILKVMEKLTQPDGTWPAAARSFLMGLIFLATIGALTDAYDDWRRREKESQLP